MDGLLPCLEGRPDIRTLPFSPKNENARADTNTKYDIILLVHDFHGLKSLRPHVKGALDLLTKDIQGSIVVVLLREGTFAFGDLVSHRNFRLPKGIVHVADDDTTLDGFVSFVTGIATNSVYADKGLEDEWRKLCRSFSHCEAAKPGQLLFSSLNTMVASRRDVAALLQ